MKIECEITKEDFARYNLHYVENSKSGKKKMNIIRIFTALCFGYVASLLWIIMFEYDFYFSGYSSFMGIAVGLIWFFVYPKIYKCQINNSAKNMVEEYQNSAFIPTRFLQGDLKYRFLKELDDR